MRGSLQFHKFFFVFDTTTAANKVKQSECTCQWCETKVEQILPPDSSTSASIVLCLDVVLVPKQQLTQLVDELVKRDATATDSKLHQLIEYPFKSHEIASAVQQIRTSELFTEMVIESQSRKASDLLLSRYANSKEELVIYHKSCVTTTVAATVVSGDEMMKVKSL